MPAVLDVALPEIGEPVLLEDLSKREQQILYLLDSDLSVPEIADELILAPSTVRSHIKSLYSKLDVHSRFEAIIRAKQLNII